MKGDKLQKHGVLAVNGKRTDRDSSANDGASPDHTLTTSVVYFVTPSRSRRVKIGVTTNLKARLARLQATNHVPLELLLALPGDQVLEGRLHNRFRDDRMHGEWFKFSDRIKQFIAEHGGRRLLPAGSYTDRAEPSLDELREAMELAQNARL